MATKGNYSKLTVDGIAVELVRGQPWELYKPVHPRHYGPRWYCVLVDREDVGHVTRWNAPFGVWRIDLFNDGGREGRVEDMDFPTRRTAIEYIVRARRSDEG